MGSDYQLRTFPGIPRGTRLDYRVTSYTRFRALEPLAEGDETVPQAAAGKQPTDARRSYGVGSPTTRRPSK